MNGALMRTRIKICGITRAEDARAAVAAGADAIGLVFYAKSPRNVSPAQAAALVATLPPFVTAVGLFVDAPPEQVEETLRQVPLGLLQFHGNESADYCAGFARPYMKAVRLRPETDLTALRATYASAAGLLIDAYTPGVPGGTGECFDWRRLSPAEATDLVVAGGLDPTNVAAAVATMRPYAVDVSSGVEHSKGVKGAELMNAFVAAVHHADHAHLLQSDL